ncbi:LAFE_0B09978g1_1 [Lachancea fermentati]|uniref:Altered inheritance of mitochondria protein 24, mitochondrial n=1 Tax=Lachancea fermentati TaxID=4955 RepID=A0A1G4M8J0_LACFM|nr:LAFE_0B09978g1_1 [Lachancea fermentati]
MSRRSGFLLGRRSISLVRPTPTTIVPTQVPQVPDVEPLFAQDADSLHTQFRVLGQPPTLASLSIPPSVSLYIRRGCIVSLLNTSELALTHSWMNPISNLLKYGSLKPSLYHKLVSSQAFNALVAPNVNTGKLGSWMGLSSTPFRTLCLLDLDGTSDWCLFGKNSVIAFEENSSLELRQSPLFFTSRKSSLPHKYEIARGRGNILLSGSGSVYTIELESPSDEIIIKSEHLLGISGTSQAEIIKSVAETQLTPTSSKITAKKSTDEASEFDLKQFWIMTKNAIISSWNFIKYHYTRFINGPTRFLKIKGPRNILVQSSYNVYLPATPSTNAQVGSSIPKALPSMEGSARNYLSYVNVAKDGEVTFSSTPNFDEEVKRLESISKK